MGVTAKQHKKKEVLGIGRWHTEIYSRGCGHVFDKHYSVLLLTLIRLKKNMHRILTFTLTVTEIDLQMTNIQIGIEDSIRNHCIVLFGGRSSPHSTGRYGVIKRFGNFVGSLSTLNHGFFFIICTQL